MKNARSKTINNLIVFSSVNKHALRVNSSPLMPCSSPPSPLLPVPPLSLPWSVISILSVHSFHIGLRSETAMKVVVLWGSLHV